MSIEEAIYTARDILQENSLLAQTLTEVDRESNEVREGDIDSPPPESFKIGNYLGRQEILAELPAVTVSAENTPSGQTGDGHLIRRHQIHIYGWVMAAEVDVLHIHMMRYGEAIRRLEENSDNWGDYWFYPEAGNTMYSDVFQAEHNLMQGCRVEIQVSEIFKEANNP